MSASPIAPTSSLGALAVVEVLTARALDSLGAQAVATPSQPEPSPQAPQPPTAIATATLQAASRQGGSAPLFADLAAVIRTPGLPAPVVAAAQQVLALATPVDPPPSAADLKAALSQSGLLLETHLAAGEGPAADLKAALLNLQSALQEVVDQAPSPAAPAAQAAPPPPTALPPSAAPSSQPVAVQSLADLPPPAPPPLGSSPAAPLEPAPASAPENLPVSALLVAQAEAQMSLETPTLLTSPGLHGGYPQASAPPPPQHGAGSSAAPPYPDGPVRAQAPANPAVALLAGAPQAVAARQLLHDTTAALARQVLFQLASAPAAQQVGDPNNVRWLFELPLATPQGTAIAQFEIDRDGGHDGEQAHGHDAESEPAWRARFSINLGDMGPVHAHVALSAGHASVSLWAEDPATAAALSAGRAGLAGDFMADAVEAQVAVFLGQPPAAAPRAGRLLDQAL